MSEWSGARPPGDGPRARIEEAITREALDAAGGAMVTPPLRLLEAPRGFGKSRLLARIAARLRERRHPVALIPLDETGTGAVDLARRLPRIVAHGAGVALSDARHPEAARVAGAIESIVSGDRPDPVRMVDLAFSFPEALARDLGHPIVILIDEIGEAMRLFHHSDLREAIPGLARRLCASRRVPIVATHAPASRAEPLVRSLVEAAGTHQRPFATTVLPPWTADDLPPAVLPAAREALIAITAGRPLHAARLTRRLIRGATLRDALLAEMTPPDGHLWHECRFDYHLLVQRCRGDASVRSILDYLVDHDPGSLSAIARHLRIRPPTAFDYLSWMMEVGLVARSGRRYRFADPLLRLWVHLRRDGDSDPRVAAEAVDALIGGSVAPSPRGAEIGETRPAPTPPPTAPGRTSPAEANRITDRLMEID